MKSPVASLFLVASLNLLAMVTPAQTTQRSNKSRARGAAETGIRKICQGVAIPAGYIIVGYKSSAACPHGAYLIKKDAESQSLRAGSEEQAQDTQSSITAIENQDTRSPINSKKQDTAPRNTVAATGNVRPPASTTKPVSRPRRVGTAQTETKAPSLIGAPPQPERQPPKLAGLTPVGSPVNAPASSPPAPGPEEVSEGDVVRVDTALVTVPVSVLDRDGRFVPNLRREDFSVFENNIQQSIAYFEPAEKPFTVALLLDTSASTHFHLSEIKEAAIAFAKQLRPQDRVLIVSFNDEVLLLTEVTNDMNVISGVVQEYAATGDSTRLYDAVDLVINERLNKIKGRKAIVLFTDGVDTSSYLATYESTLREVEELDALIYPIQYDTSDYMRAMQGQGNITVQTTTSNWPFPSSSSSSRVIYGSPSYGGTPAPGMTQADYDRAGQYLRELSAKTGGRLYQANDPSQLAQAFSRIAEELRRQYSLGYYPETTDSQSAERRQIRVRVREPNLAVRARDSYVRSSSSSPTR